MLVGVASADPKPLVAVHVRGDTKVTEVTATRLARLSLGDPVSEETLEDPEAERLAGETSTESRKPSRLSSITDIMVKIEVKSTIMMSAPGKKYSRKCCPPLPEVRIEEPKPEPITSQNSTGEAITPTTRLRMR